MIELVQAAAKGDYEAARRFHHRLFALCSQHAGPGDQSDSDQGSDANGRPRQRRTTSADDAAGRDRGTAASRNVVRLRHPRNRRRFVRRSTDRLHPRSDPRTIFLHSNSRKRVMHATRLSSAIVFVVLTGEFVFRRLDDLLERQRASRIHRRHGSKCRSVWLGPTRRRRNRSWLGKDLAARRSKGTRCGIVSTSMMRCRLSCPTDVRTSAAPWTIACTVSKRRSGRHDLELLHRGTDSTGSHAGAWQRSTSAATMARSTV